MLTKKEQARYRAIINQLSRMSRDGWSQATHPNYKPLEAELDQLSIKLTSPVTAGHSRSCRCHYCQAARRAVTS